MHALQMQEHCTQVAAFRAEAEVCAAGGSCSRTRRRRCACRRRGWTRMRWRWMWRRSTCSGRDLETPGFNMGNLGTGEEGCATGALRHGLQRSTRVGRRLGTGSGGYGSQRCGHSLWPEDAYGPLPWSIGIFWKYRQHMCLEQRSSAQLCAAGGSVLTAQCGLPVRYTLPHFPPSGSFWAQVCQAPCHMQGWVRDSLIKRYEGQWLN